MESKTDRKIFNMKFWFFGDSFTQGYGCLEHYEYFNKYNNTSDYEKKIWVHLISEYFEVDSINLGMSGNSNPYIVNQIIENLSNIKPNDTVFISSTFPERTLLYNKKYSRIYPATTDMITDDHFELGDKYKNRFYNKFLYTDESKNAFLEYLTHLRMPNIEVWNSYYSEQFKNLKMYLEGIGVNVYLWSSYIEFKLKRYQTIEECTNGDIVDGHWSFKGHYDFYQQVIKNLENKSFDNLSLITNI